MGSTTKEIDPYGDVLVLPASTTTTNTTTTRTKLRVSSKVLSTASPVFRSMFSTRFREGAALASTTALIEIEFLDDSPQALEAVFNVLHFRHDCVNTNVGHDALHEIALVADKYDLAGALGPWKEVWLRGGGGSEGRGLFVLYVLGSREGFREGCRTAVMQDLGYGDAGDGGNDGRTGDRGGENLWDYDVLPGKVVELISAYRISTIKSLISVTEQFRSLYQGPSVKCKTHKPVFVFGSPNSNTQALTCDAVILGSLIRHEAAIGIFPTPSPPYKGISAESLALSMKKLHCLVDTAMGHGGCTITGQVVKMVDEVLARVGMWDIWD